MIDLSPISYISAGLFWENKEDIEIYNGESVYTESQVLEMLRIMRDKCADAGNYAEERYIDVHKAIMNVPAEIPKND